MVEAEKKYADKLLLFVIGTTAVGKSKLALDLAQHFNAEIINADSMQIYSGNKGIMTAKPEKEETDLVPHHLYDFVDMHETGFNVQRYRSLAVAKVKEIFERRDVAVVVGGTNYYIEALAFRKENEGECSREVDKS